MEVVGEIFEDWIRTDFPDRAEKVLRQVSEVHGSSLGDSRFGTRMRGQLAFADAINSLYKLAKRQHVEGRQMPPANLEAFRPAGVGAQLELF